MNWFSSECVLLACVHDTCVYVTAVASLPPRAEDWTWGSSLTWVPLLPTTFFFGNFESVSLSIPSRTWTEPVVLVPQPPECWDQGMCYCAQLPCIFYMVFQITFNFMRDFAVFQMIIYCFCSIMCKVLISLDHLSKGIWLLAIHMSYFTIYI